LNLLILGGGTGGTIAAWTFAQRGQPVPENRLLAKEKMLFTARKLLAEAKSSASPKEMSGNDSHIQTKEK